MRLLSIITEITVKGAEKGPAIQEYIESLGYKAKREVMVFGDSLNDYLMLSMDFKSSRIKNANVRNEAILRIASREAAFAKKPPA